MKNVQLSIEQAKTLYNSNPEFRNTFLSVFTDDELGIDNFPKKWEDLKKIKGWFVDNWCSINPASIETHNSSKNTVPTEKHAKSILAFCQLSMLLNQINGESNLFKEPTTYSINRVDNSLELYCLNNTKKILSFKTRKDAEKSLIHHKQLWEDYWML